MPLGGGKPKSVRTTALPRLRSVIRIMDKDGKELVPERHFETEVELPWSDQAQVLAHAQILAHTAKAGEEVVRTSLGKSMEISINRNYQKVGVAAWLTIEVPQEESYIDRGYDFVHERLLEEHDRRADDVVEMLKSLQ